MKRILTTLCVLMFVFPLHIKAQTYQDYFGNGHSIGISASGSDLTNANDAINSINGTDILPDLAGASRFLAQATLGYNYETIEYVSQIGIKEWLDEQLSMGFIPFTDGYDSIYSDVNNTIGSLDDGKEDEYLGYNFYEKTLKEQDYLRQKVAYALNQILVVSYDVSSNNDRSDGNSDYYNVLYDGAFGNYRDMLQEVTMHHSMGLYLSTFGNRKADFILGTYPDENYAREVMQLFTIGLHELNNDGTLKLDENGDLIPTYDIKDIQELSKVFTGLGPAERLDGSTVYYTTSLGNLNWRVNMAMYELYHDKTEKVMIDGTVLPAGQPGLQDVNDALDIIFNHPNVGPFVSTRLIQQMVKSNPSPAYINRVATVFNNNGAGVRGDMGAVVKAILLDPEARNCQWIEHAQSGKLLQPLERIIGLFVAFDLQTPSGRIYFKDKNALLDDLGQAFMASPSVFNFFSPFYAEKDHVAPNDMVSPEFQILSSTSSIDYLNIMEYMLTRKPFDNKTLIQEDSTGTMTNPDDEPFLDFSDEITILDNDGVIPMLDRLNILLCRGQLSPESKSIIKNAIDQYRAGVVDFTSEDAVKAAIYLIMASPDYMILK